MVLTVVIGTALAILLMFVWQRNGRLQWQVDKLSNKAAKLGTTNKPSLISDSLLQQTYKLLRKSLLARDEVLVYKSVDILKTVFSCGIVPVDAPHKLAKVIVVAVRSGQVTSAVNIVDAFKPLLRYAHESVLPIVVEQLALIGAISFKHRQTVVAAKAVEILMSISGQNNGNDSMLYNSMLKVVKFLGVLALRRKDEALFREITNRLSEWVNQHNLTATMPLDVLTVWLHLITLNNDELLFGIWKECAERILCYEERAADILATVLQEWQPIIGTACLNSNNIIIPKLLVFIIDLTSHSRSLSLWRYAASNVGRIATMALIRHGVAKAFPIMYPLFAAGCRSLAREIKFSVAGSDFYRQVLFIILHECLLAAELKARKDMTKSTGEVIIEIYKCWLSWTESHNSPKAVQKYCQLLLLFWRKTRRHADKEFPYIEDIFAPILITDDDRKRLEL